MKGVLSYLGISLTIVGLLFLVPSFAALFFGEPLLPFLLPFVILIIISIPMQKYFKRKDLSMSGAFVFATTLFIIMAFFGAIPYIMTPSFGGSFVDAYFESMSGFTTTGLTIIDSLEAQPKSLLLWRGFTQWIGGIGIVVLFLSVLVLPGISSYYLSKAEGKDQRIWPSIIKTAREQLKIYLFYTFLGAIILSLVGVPLFDSFAHIFTSVSTGGFSSHALSIETIEKFGNPMLIDFVVIVFMIIGSTSFLLHSKILRKNFREYISSKEVQLFYVIIIFSTVLLATDQFLLGDANFFRHSIFQTVSALTTTGFVTVSLKSLSEFGKYILIILMIFGGGSGSTSGGLKMIRVALFIKAVPWLIKRMILPPKSVVPLKLGRIVFSESEALVVGIYTTTYIFLLLGGTLAIMADGFTFLDSLFESASALGTVGMSLGITTKLSITSKIIVVAEMLMGRLEIIPIFGALLMFTRARRYVL